MKKVISLLLVLTTLCGLLAVPSFAATTAFDKLTTTKYAKVFTLSASGKTIPYTNKNLNTRGTESYGASSSSYIANKNDELYLMDVGYTNGKWWAYVQYPSGSKRVKAYIPLSAITSNNGTHAKGTSSGKFYCSLRSNAANSTSYYVAKGDEVYLIATSGSKYQIMYPAGSKWRIAWCNASDYNKYVAKKQPVANGIYTIASAVGNNQMVDVCGGSRSNGGNIWLWEKNGQAPQDFELTYHSGGYYTIKNVGSGLYIDVAGGSNALGTNIQQHQGNGSNAQKWYLEDAGNNYYYLRSALGRYFDVADGRAVSGTNIRLWDGNGSNAQKFKFIEKKNSGTNSPQTDTAALVQARLDEIANGTRTYDKKTIMAVGKKFTGTRASEQCKGYARNVFQLCFGVYVNSTQPKPDNYLLYSTNGATKLGSVTGIKKTDGNYDKQIKGLFDEARPGDFVQMRRQHGGSHSAIVYSVSSEGVKFLEANTDDKNSVTLELHKWHELRKNNAAMSLYTANNYKLK